MRKFPRILFLAVALSALAFLAACGGGGGTTSNITTGGGGGTTTGNSAVALNVLIPPGLAGNSAVSQYVFNNSQAPVAGASFQVEWSAIDTGSGYDWSVPDGSIGTLPSDKKANLIFWANSDSAEETCANGQYGLPNVGNCAIPAYVWTQLGPSNYTTCNPSNANGPQQIPNYFAAAFKTNYQNFIAAAIAHYASNSQVGYIRFGLGRGGETIPVGDWDATSSSDQCPVAFANWGLTDSTISLWESYLQTMLTFEANNNPSKLQLMVGITPMNGNAVPIFVAQTAVPLGIGFGSQGLESSDVGNCAGSTADWCGLFNQYTGQVPLELQTIGQSCPQSPTSCPTGSLATLLPFAIANHATIFELYYEDWLTAFDPNYTGGYDSLYAAVFISAAGGQQ